MGPGTFTLGAGTPLEVSCQVTSLSLDATENITTEDAIHVLCGETLPAQDTVDYTYALSGTFLQDLSLGGVVQYSWDHKGESVAFTYVPNTAQGTEIVGVVRCVPLRLGGDVTTRGTSDFTWVVPEEPTITWAAAA